MTTFSIHDVEKDADYDSAVTGMKDSERNQIRLVFDQRLKGTEADVSNLSAELDQQEIKKKGSWTLV